MIRARLCLSATHQAYPDGRIARGFGLSYTPPDISSPFIRLAGRRIGETETESLFTNCPTGLKLEASKLRLHLLGPLAAASAGLIGDAQRAYTAAQTLVPRRLDARISLYWYAQDRYRPIAFYGFEARVWNESYDLFELTERVKAGDQSWPELWTARRLPNPDSTGVVGGYIPGIGYFEDDNPGPAGGNQPLSSALGAYRVNLEPRIERRLEALWKRVPGRLGSFD